MPDTWWLYAVHGVLGGALLVATVAKLRRSVPRATAAGRWLRLAIAGPVAFLVLGSLAAGFAAAVGGDVTWLGPWTLLGWHAMLGFVIVPLLVLHLFPRRWRLLRPTGRSAHLSRRSFLAGLVVGIGGLAIVPIPTTFLGESAPAIDPETWRLRVTGAIDAPLELTLDQLEMLGSSELGAVLDCTGGWALETTWQGVPMTALLDAAGLRRDATRVEVASVTGWAAALNVEEVRRTFLATGVAGSALPLANGAPCRLVVPDRRGLDWVKWVGEIRVS